jgi:hypothetical protein
MSDDTRQQLAFMQAQVMRALVEGKTAPAGFDRGRLEAAAEALLLKRARAVAQAWPQLARLLGDEFADGRAMISWLERAGLLTDEGRLEAFVFDARYRLHKGVITRRRGPAVRVRRLGAMRRLVILLRLPVFGERWLKVKIL